MRGSRNTVGKVLTRSQALRAVLTHAGPHCHLVSGLGYMSRDLFALAHRRGRICFYSLGAMGSVVPFCLGLSLGAPWTGIVGIEGDGSLLMNLGSLSSLARYGSSRLAIVILDNRCYESTGGQPSQPAGMSLERVARTCSVPASVAESVSDIAAFFHGQRRARGARLLVVRTALGPAAARVSPLPRAIAQAFKASILQKSHDAFEKRREK
jgi:sulfopyruvate decarboxylase subunit beta